MGFEIVLTYLYAYSFSETIFLLMLVHLISEFVLDQNYRSDPKLDLVSNQILDFSTPVRQM